MPAKTFPIVLDKTINIIAISERELCLITIYDTANRDRIRHYEAKFSAGEGLDLMNGDECTTIPTDNISHVIVYDTYSMLDILYNAGNKTKLKKLFVETRNYRESEKIAREIALNSGRTCVEQRAVMPLSSAFEKPLGLMVLGLIVSGVLYVIASGAEAGENLADREAKKAATQIAILLATLFGTKGILIVSIVIILICLFWMTMILLHRPKQLSIKFN